MSNPFYFKILSILLYDIRFENNGERHTNSKHMFNDGTILELYIFINNFRMIKTKQEIVILF